ncbi:lamin tail domain-containing protein [Arsenicicoccus dermatophilus]|uniref:lamin tail domain-containing protein n=1 Tax=Arsenicicoccus dermatophilus TaxID=1076331 RepID=UPI001F4D3261|nr:lamin tail domain-containing protein [Arsenicicoccus dermatophilus]MCH8614051.1 lamin tail domain-containing protein [Arsenicicoccus dermatophilus]
MLFSYKNIRGNTMSAHRPAPALSALVAAGLLLAPAAAAEAATSPLQLGRFQADAGGTKVKDTKANVNGEWIQVRNTSAKALGVAGYVLRDAYGHRYVFPRGAVIPARGVVTVYSGRGTNGKGRFYWNQGWHVWNNTGETATLLSPKSVRLDVCTYKKNAAGYVNC